MRIHTKSQGHSAWIYYTSVALFPLATPLSAATQDYGPLRSYAQSPFQSNTLAPQLRSARSYQTGQQEIYASASAASVWAVSDSYTLDYYQNSLSVGWELQADQDWRIELSYRWLFSADNHIDGLTKAFHSWFGISQNGRDEVARDRAVFSLPQNGFDEQDIEGKTLTSAFSAYSQYLLYQDTHHALSLGATLYYNHVAHGPFKGQQFEQAVQVNYSWQHRQHAIYTYVGFTHHDQDGWPDGQFDRREYTLSGAIGYAYQWSPHHHWLAQYHVYQGEVDDAGELSRPSHEIALGYRYVMKQSAIELFLVENALNMDNSTDIAFQLNYRYRFE